MVLAMLQLILAQAQADDIQKGQRNLLDTMNIIFGKFMIRLGDIFTSVETCTAQGVTLIRSSATIIHIALQVYQRVLDIHKFVTLLPPQVRQDQPVYFVDAYGKETAFYLDFVFSSKVFIDWLMRRFETIGQGKIARGEFALSDSRTRRELDLCEPWDVLFHPGMHVDMDMIFQEFCAPTEVNSCPACHSVNDDKNGGRITCFKCNLQFHRTSSGSLSQSYVYQDWLFANKTPFVDGPGSIQDNHEHCRIHHFRRLKLILASDLPKKGSSGAKFINAATPAPSKPRQKQPLFPAESIGQVAALGLTRVEATRYLATLGNRRDWCDKSPQIYLFHYIIGASNIWTDFQATLGRYDFRDPRFDFHCD
ncbi:hypothetical protein SBOR_9407 [Sclerotinia borealis F-4128]|uniref:Ubiquitin-like domain-containing protein n=1 Tax=Sclerotinia borealis (strain F-4128) TaxID=1432307 RepID=W9C6K2_SCLBF|nr:hypothetical protein SBOR_9407 [Sclerotinia borealis F-4128]